MGQHKTVKLTSTLTVLQAIMEIIRQCQLQHVVVSPKMCALFLVSPRQELDHNKLLSVYFSGRKLFQEVDFVDANKSSLSLGRLLRSTKRHKRNLSVGCHVDEAAVSIFLDSDQVPRGQSLCGNVVVTLQEKMLTNGVYIKVEGCDACCYMSGSEQMHACRPFFNREVPLDAAIDAINEDEVTCSLSAGAHHFPFFFPINRDLPLSLKKAADAEFKRGVSYKVTAELRLVKGRKVVQASETFQVVGKPNWAILEASNPLVKTVACPWDSCILMSASLPRQHFAVGEIMPLTLTLNIPAEDRKTKVEVRFIEENVQQLKGKVSYNNMVLKQLEC